jgi:hypothetical protein
MNEMAIFGSHISGHYLVQSLSLASMAMSVAHYYTNTWPITLRYSCHTAGSYSRGPVYWEIEKIRDGSGHRQKKEHLVLWKQYLDSGDQWVKEEDIEDEIVKECHQKLLQEGRPAQIGDRRTRGRE